MPSIQSRAVEVLVRLLRWKRASNRMRERVESGRQTYTEPTRRQCRKYLVSKRNFRGHLVWTIKPKQNPGRKHIIYLHGGGFVNSFASQQWNFMCRLIDALDCTATIPRFNHAIGRASLMVSVSNIDSLSPKDTGRRQFVPMISTISFSACFDSGSDINIQS